MYAIQSAIRSIQTAVNCPRLTRFSLLAPKTVEVEFANGSAYNLSAEFLRIYSPAADSKVRLVGGEKVIGQIIHFLCASTSMDNDVNVNVK
ncbi:unnamed protein product [Ilex paraguariensis]|uniref:Gamma-butyrobetaine hydroxylase-like N-terminal domain-containing protein n=1 Tax=Ilex paraguariensis TaxID=185542 RepID=A0ABC8SX10_9AQUA